MKLVPYRLPKVVATVNSGATIFIVEGEKDCHRLEKLGFVATCNPGGAGKWRPEFSRWFGGAGIVILPDNDNAGRQHGQDVARKLSGAAKSIKVVDLPDLPPKGDVTDWVEAGATADELLALVESALEWTPAEPDRPKKRKSQPVESAFPLTDLGNSERLICAHGGDLRFDVDAGKWLVWNGAYWQHDCTGQVDRLARRVVRSLYNELKAVEDRGRATELFRHIKTSEGGPRLAAMMDLARWSEGIPVQAAELDHDAMLLNVLNGALDLRTGKLRPHTREDLITRIVEIDYDPAATCPTWERFLQEIFQGDSALVDFVQRAMGYALTGDVSEQCFFLLHGGGSNGKSTLMTVLREILCDYHRKTPTDTLLDRNDSGIPNDLARLRGARIVTAIEAKPGRRLAETLVKELTGGDSISARFLRQEFFDFVPVFKLWLACNHLPTVDGQDHAIWRRVRLIPFGVVFNAADSETGPYIDKLLPDKLRLEYPGILAWMVRGCLKWQTSGLPTPEAVKAATGDYKIDMDVLGEFLGDCCVVTANSRLRTSELYDAYRVWAEAAKEKYPLSKKAFGLRMRERGFQDVRTRTGERWWFGIGLTTDDDPANDPDDDTANAPFADRMMTHDDTFEGNSGFSPMKKTISNKPGINSKCVIICHPEHENASLGQKNAVSSKTKSECETRVSPDRTCLLAWAEKHGWQALKLGPSLTVGPGEEEWRSWVHDVCDATIEVALSVIRRYEL